MATVERKRGKSITYRGGDGQIVVEWPLEYQVVDTTETLTESQIIETAGLPKINEIVQVDGSRIPVACKSKSANQDPQKKSHWTVMCMCDNLPGKASQALGTGESEDDPTDPTQWTVVVDLSFEQAELVVETDVFGNPIQNFADRPYAEPVIQRRLIPVLSFTQYEQLATSLRDIYGRNDSVNDATFAGGVKGGWKLSVEDADIVYKNGILCYRVDYKIRYFEKYVTNLATNGQLFTLDSGGNSVDVTGTDLVLSIGTEKVVGGWNPIRPQLDYIDINGAPVVDAKDNQILGKLDTSGVRASGATQGSALTYWLLHQATPYQNFASFLRIQGA